MPRPGHFQYRGQRIGFVLEFSQDTLTEYASSVHYKMLFEWDDAKSQRNLVERGFGFDHAAAIFLGPTLEAQDNRRDYGEIRVQAIGRAGDDILSVI